MFTSEERERLLAELIARARADDVVTAAALVGSAARHQLDRWSDLDLALRLVDGADVEATADRWAADLAAAHDVADHLDVWAGPTLYRVFLLAGSLQVDLSFWPAATFASNGEFFEVLFGEAHAPSTPTAPDPRTTVGWAWLYALHARSAIARDRRWQAVQMLAGLRDQLVTLACRRYGLPAYQGRGVDRLPAPLLDRLLDTRPSAPETLLLVTAFRAAVDLLLVEVGHLDPAWATRLRGPLTDLVTSVAHP